MLVVEDDKFSFEYIRVGLRNRGLEIIHAWDGEKALQIFSDTRDIDLILLDIQIPVIDGYTLCKMIRKEDQQIPIIAQTAYVLNGEDFRCEEVGCNAYLSKPLDIGKLIELIDQFLS